MVVNSKENQNQDLFLQELNHLKQFFFHNLLQNGISLFQVYFKFNFANVVRPRESSLFATHDINGAKLLTPLRFL